MTEFPEMVEQGRTYRRLGVDKDKCPPYTVEGWVQAWKQGWDEEDAAQKAASVPEPSSSEQDQPMNERQGVGMALSEAELRELLHMHLKSLMGGGGTIPALIATLERCRILADALRVLQEQPE